MPGDASCFAFTRMPRRAGPVRRAVTPYHLKMIRRTLLAGRSTETKNDENTPRKEKREINMRSFLLIAAALLAFGATMAFETTDANAVVCARGVYRAGCAGARGAVVVRHPVARCRSVLVNGVYVRRCY